MELKSVTGLTVQSDLGALKVDVANIIDLYKDFVVHADNITEAKQIMADMNKAYKFADDKRKAIKKAYTAELSIFEKDMKEILSALPETRENIKTQLEVYEAKRVAVKTSKANDILENLLDESGLDLRWNKNIVLPDGFANVSFSLKAISDSITIQISNAEKEVEAYLENCITLKKHILFLNDSNNLVQVLEYSTPKIDADFMQLMATASKTAGDRAKSECMAIKAAEDKKLAGELKEDVAPEVVEPVFPEAVGHIVNQEVLENPAYSVKMFCDEEKFKEILSWLDVDKIKYEVM